MAVACPYCEFQMSVRGAKAGRYTPACQGCGRKFLIVVSEEAGVLPVVKTFEAGVAEVQRAAAVGKTVTGVTAVPHVGKVEHVAQKSEHVVHRAHVVAAETAAPGQVDGHTRETERMAGGTTRAAAANRMPMPEMPEMLGGYKIEKKLGEGGMGAVYLARQISLDRPVAVKVMNRAWANDPEFIARFTREAYAAAQLTHHNVVQIHDIGVEGDVHFFSMEYVPGKTLGALVHDQKRLDPEEAAGYALQAARGLKFAHDHGMIHRDIKPENLLLNEQGIVKVLDLGLVKTPEGKEKALKLAAGKAPEGAGPAASLMTGTTQMNVSMGTPDYMSPEQAQDAAGVDGRADIYSLGCTLYDFVVGRPPFVGRTVMEVLTKHASEPVTPPEVLVKRVPAGLSHIMQKMVAKRKEERYPSMDVVVAELEGFLGVNSAGPFSPKEADAAVLEKSVGDFNGAGLAGVRRNLIWLGVIGGLAAMGVLAFLGWWMMAGAVAGLLVLTAVSYQVVIGVTQGTHVFTRVRQLVFGAGVMDWVKVFGAVVLGGLVLWIMGLLWVWIGVGVVAVGIALGLALGLDVMVRRQRKPAVEAVRGMLKGMRLKGLAEDALRQFVCKYSGNNWEEFYEALFGYEAKMQARDAWGRGESGRARKKFGAWRDGLIAWAEGRMKKRREERERAMLYKLEEKRFKAGGASEGDARRKAREAAEWMVGQATVVREEKKRRGAVTAGPVPTVMRFDAEPSEAEMVAAKRERARVSASRSTGGKLGVMILGPQVRLVLGILAVGVCLWWLQQNKALSAERVRSWVMDNFQGGYARVAEPWKVVPDATGMLDGKLEGAVRMKPLNVPMLSARMTEKMQWELMNGLSWGIAGVLLVVSSLWRGVRISFLMIPAAVVMIAGETLGVPEVMGFAGWQVAYGVGAVLAAGGFWWGREVG